MQDCIFCKIVTGKESANVVFENENILVILDKDPISKGHCLVITKEHVKDYVNINEILGGELMKTVGKVASAITKACPYDGTMVTTVSGKFQDVPHLHIHVFGRKKSNDIQIKYPLQEQNPDSPESVAIELRANFV